MSNQISKDRLVIKFKDFRPYINICSALSIVRYRDLSYANYWIFEEVPDKYDEMYVYNVAIRHSEFLATTMTHRALAMAWHGVPLDTGTDDELYMLPCLDITLGDEVPVF